MKKVIFVTLALALAATTAFAQEIKAYGSARLGYWYEMPNEDYAGGESDFDPDPGFRRRTLIERKSVLLLGSAACSAKVPFERIFSASFAGRPGLAGSG